MYAMQLASASPSALVDWNNNYGADEDKCVLFHCGNWAKSFLPDAAVGTAPILGTMGEGRSLPPPGVGAVTERRAHNPADPSSGEDRRAISPAANARCASANRRASPASRSHSISPASDAERHTATDRGTSRNTATAVARAAVEVMNQSFRVQFSQGEQTFESTRSPTQSPCEGLDPTPIQRARDSASHGRASH